MPMYSVTLVDRVDGNILGDIISDTRLGKSSFDKVKGLITALVASIRVVIVYL